MTLALCTFALLALAAPAGQGLLPNPGFEQDADGDGLPDGWRFSWRNTHSGDATRAVPKTKPDFGWDKTTFHSGRASVRIGVARSTDDGVWTAELPLPAPRPRYFRVTAWIKTQHIANTDARVAGVCLGPKGEWLSADYGVIVANRDRDWTLYSGYWELHPKTARIRVRLWLNFHYTGTGTAWFDDIALAPADRAEKPRTRYVEQNKPPQPTPNERDRGYILFSRNYLRLLFENSVPLAEERVAELSLSAAPGEAEPRVLAIYALRDLPRVELRASDLRGPRGATIPAARIDIRRVRFHDKQGQERWGPYNAGLMRVPLFLEPAAHASVRANSTQPFWITVHVPEDAPPGEYTGSVAIAAQGAAPATVSLRVTVWPFKLAQPRGIFFGMYARFRSDPEWLLRNFRDMRAHGMTTVGLCSPFGGKMLWQGARVVIPWDGTSALERAMDAYVKAGFPEPLVWLMGGDIVRFALRQGELESEAFARAYRGVIEEILRRAKQLSWPEIIFQPVDEPFEHYDRMPTARRCLEILKSIPGVRTEEDGPNTKSRRLNEVYDLCDFIVFHDGPVMVRGTFDAQAWREFLARIRRDGKAVWFYNIDLTGWHPEPQRFMYGFGLWHSGATGCLSWCYQNAVNERNPELVYQRPAALLYCFPQTKNELGGPCTGWEATREGVDDYRYILTLRQLVDRALASPAPNIRALAQRLWAEVQKKLDEIDFHACEGRAMQGNWTGPCELAPNGDTVVSGDHKMQNGWTFDDYDALRTQIAQAIIALTKALRG